jgi:hypothetical protein
VRSKFVGLPLTHSGIRTMVDGHPDIPSFGQDRSNSIAFVKVATTRSVPQVRSRRKGLANPVLYLWMDTVSSICSPIGSRA